MANASIKSSSTTSSTTRMGRAASRASGRTLASSSTTGSSNARVSTSLGQRSRAARVATANGRTRSTSPQMSTSNNQLSTRARVAMKADDTRVRASHARAPVGKTPSKKSPDNKSSQDLDAMSKSLFTSVALGEPVEMASSSVRSPRPVIDESTELLNQYRAMRSEVTKLLDGDTTDDNSGSLKPSCGIPPGEENLSCASKTGRTDAVSNDCASIRLDLAALRDKVSQQSEKVNQMVDCQHTLLGHFERCATLQGTRPLVEMSTHSQVECSSPNAVQVPLAPAVLKHVMAKPVVSPPAFPHSTEPVASPIAFSNISLHPARVIQANVVYPPANNHTVLPQGSPRTSKMPMTPHGDDQRALVAWLPKTCRTYQAARSVSPRKLQSPIQMTSMERQGPSSSSRFIGAGNSLPVLLGTASKNISYQPEVGIGSALAMQSDAMPLSARVATPYSSRRQDSYVVAPRKQVQSDGMLLSTRVATPYSPRRQDSYDVAPCKQGDVKEKDPSNPPKKYLADCVHKVTAQALRQFRKQRTESGHLLVEPRLES